MQELVVVSPRIRTETSVESGDTGATTEGVCSRKGQALSKHNNNSLFNLQSAWATGTHARKQAKWLTRHSRVHCLVKESQIIHPD